jgi:ABC-type dipeptide/oligopeptide/nickel transport system permease component
VTRLLIRRALASLLLVWIVASCGFLLAALAPGDVAVIAGGIGATPEQIAAMRAEAGLDRPLAVQYGAWLGRLVRGDLGTSFLYRAPVAPMVVDRAVNTAMLAVTALVLALVIGLPPAVLCATRPASIAARAIRAIALLLLSIPPFVGALALVLVAARTGWLPAGGMTSGADLTGAGWLADVLWHLPLPALALALPLAATFERQQSVALAEALATPAVQAARARGVGDAQIVRRHAWRLSLKPVLALGGLAMAALLGGAFVVETITAWPGLGRLTHDALRARDIPLVAGCALAGSTVLAIGLFVSDVLTAWADPRVRLEQ